MRLVETTGAPSGKLIDGEMALAVWAVPMEIATCEGTKSGSLKVWARLKKICRFCSEFSDEARSAALKFNWVLAQAPVSMHNAAHSKPRNVLTPFDTRSLPKT